MLLNLARLSLVATGSFVDCDDHALFVAAAIIGDVVHSRDT
jgi:hypothetical protein